MKSLLSFTIGSWFAEGNTNPNAFPKTIEPLFSRTTLLVQILAKVCTSIESYCSTSFIIHCRSNSYLGISKVEWVFDPLSHCVEIFAEISPKDVSSLLMVIWNFIREFPPSPNQYANSTTGMLSLHPSPLSSSHFPRLTYGLVSILFNRSPQIISALFKRNYPENFAASKDQYLMPLKDILHNNITKLCYFYSRFFPPNQK